METKKEIFLRIAKQSSNLKEIIINDIQIEKQPFYDFMNEISRNDVIEKFSLKKVEIVGNFKKMISIVNTLRYKKSLKSLEFIEIPNLGEKKGKACLCLINELPNIEQFIFKDSELGDTDQEFISCIISLKKKNFFHLDLSGNYFQNKLFELLKSFKDNDSLTTICLEKMNINEHCIDVLLYGLKNNLNLTELKLSNNPIKNGMKHFKSLFNYQNNLTKLSLENCNINDISFESLLKGLIENKILKELNLNYNDITQNGKYALKDFFSINNTLTSIYLLRNKLRNNDIIYFLDSK